MFVQPQPQRKTTGTFQHVVAPYEANASQRNHWEKIQRTHRDAMAKVPKLTDQSTPATATDASWHRARDRSRAFAQDKVLKHIDQENRRLIGNLAKVVTKPSEVSRMIDGEKRPQVPQRGLEAERKKKREVAFENQMLVKRLLSVRSGFDRKSEEKDFARHRRTLDLMRKIPPPGAQRQLQKSSTSPSLPRLNTGASTATSNNFGQTTQQLPLASSPGGSPGGSPAAASRPARTLPPMSRTAQSLPALALEPSPASGRQPLWTPKASPSKDTTGQSRRKDVPGSPEGVVATSGARVSPRSPAGAVTTSSERATPRSPVVSSPMVQALDARATFTSQSGEAELADLVVQKQLSGSSREQVVQREQPVEDNRQENTEDEFEEDGEEEVDEQPVQEEVEVKQAEEVEEEGEGQTDEECKTDAREEGPSDNPENLDSQEPHEEADEVEEKEDEDARQQEAAEQEQQLRVVEDDLDRDAQRQHEASAEQEQEERRVVEDDAGDEEDDPFESDGEVERPLRATQMTEAKEASRDAASENEQQEHEKKSEEQDTLADADAENDWKENEKKVEQDDESEDEFEESDEEIEKEGEKKGEEEKETKEQEDAQQEVKAEENHQPERVEEDHQQEKVEEAHQTGETEEHQEKSNFEDNDASFKDQEDDRPAQIDEEYGDEFEDSDVELDEAGETAGSRFLAHAVKSSPPAAALEDSAAWG